MATSSTSTTPRLADLRLGARFRVEQINQHQFSWARGQAGRLTDIRCYDFMESGIGVRLEFPDGREALFNPEQLRPIRE